MVADGPGPAPLPEWRLQTDAGEFVVTDTVLGPNGAIDWAAADTLLAAKYAEPGDGMVATVVQAGFMSLFTVPLVLWLAALSLVFFVAWSIAEGRVEMHQF